MAAPKTELDTEKGTLPPLILADDPVTDSGELRDGIDRFARRLARVLDALPASSPVLIHGDWGIGKTSLLHAIERHASPRPVIWFHAWRYERETTLLPALLRRIWESTPEEFRKSKENEALYGKIWRAAVTIGLSLVPALLSAFGVPFAPLVDTGPKTVSDNLAAMEEKTRTPQEDATAELWNDMAELVRKAWPGKRPLVLVDDLDRCHPEGAVALLDGIRLLVTGAPPPQSSASGAVDGGESKGGSGSGRAESVRLSFVVALDRGVVVDAITRKFHGMADYDGNRYLEKLFPVSFAVPAPFDEDARDLVNLFLTGKRRTKSEKSPDLDEALRDMRDALGEALKDPLFANPRLMKRCINRFRLVTYFEQGSPAPNDAKAAKERALSDRTLAKWIVATERWPRLRPLILRKKADYWDRIQSALRGDKGAPLDTEAEAMVRDPKLSVWLQKELFGAEARLEEHSKAEERLRKWGM